MYVPGLLRGSTPGGSRNVVSQICENVSVTAARAKRRSTPAALATFHTLMEDSRSEVGACDSIYIFSFFFSFFLSFLEISM